MTPPSLYILSLSMFEYCPARLPVHVLESTHVMSCHTGPHDGHVKNCNNRLAAPRSCRDKGPIREPESVVATRNPAAPNLHVALSVRCPDGVLHVKPAKSEGAPYQIRALEEAVGKGAIKDVLAVCTDNPEVLDSKARWERFTSINCIIKDPIHVAIKVEKASKERITQFALRVASKFT